MTAFKSMIFRYGVDPGKTGNVMPAADAYAELLVMHSADSSIFSPNDGLLHDHDYESWMPIGTSVVIENTIVYVAGWVVRKLLPIISCDICT